MLHLTISDSLVTFERTRAYDLAVGTVTAAVCFALAIPTLYRFLPRHRAFLFGQRTDPRQFLQLGFGLVCMAMGVTDALCRYIPHGPLGLVHPVFLATTLTLVLLLAPRLLRMTSNRGRAVTPLAAAALQCALVLTIAAPIAAVVAAFRS